MEIDIELNLGIAAERADTVEKSLPPLLTVRRFKRRQGVGIRWQEGVAVDGPLDAAICDFLNAVKQHVSTDDTKKGELRVGVFLEQDEVASMTVLLSATTVQALAELDVAVEVSFYPCDDASSEMGS